MAGATAPQRRGNRFIPIEQKVPAERQCDPVKWYALIKEMEAFREKTGMGLSRTWAYVNRGQYEEARRDFDRVLQEHGMRFVTLADY
ncbi:hypothetical protein [Micromonospora sp. S4605]|uniref:hypothetical protein n=1 Tax=Micromonospora sp. S4605 TaxID=1420897 RepID=UPI0011B4AD23|nr:hypothetical protein [Micromonospora sp. S4605]